MIRSSAPGSSTAPIRNSPHPFHRSVNITGYTIIYRRSILHRPMIWMWMISYLYYVCGTYKNPQPKLWVFMLALPVFPGRPTYCRAVCNSPVDCYRRKKAPIFRSRLLCWHYLSSRAVARQVLSAQMSLTSVFGMGTGGPSLQSTPTRMDGGKPIFYIYTPSGVFAAQ